MSQQYLRSRLLSTLALCALPCHSAVCIHALIVVLPCVYPFSLSTCTSPSQAALVLKCTPFSPLFVLFPPLCVSGKPRPSFDQTSVSLPALTHLLQSSECDSQVLADALWSLSFLSDDDTNERISAVLDVQPPVLRRFVELMTHGEANVGQPALRTVRPN